VHGEHSAEYFALSDKERRAKGIRASTRISIPATTTAGHRRTRDVRDSHERLGCLADAQAGTNGSSPTARVAGAVSRMKKQARWISISGDSLAMARAALSLYAADQRQEIGSPLSAKTVDYIDATYPDAKRRAGYKTSNNVRLAARRIETAARRKCAARTPGDLLSTTRRKKKYAAKPPKTRVSLPDRAGNRQPLPAPPPC